MAKGNCIIFGGGGFIGINLTEKLLKEGYNVTVYDRNLKEKQIGFDSVIKVEGDFFNENNLGKLLKKQDVVIHLISSVSPASSMKEIYNPYQKDVVKSLELLDSCYLNGVKKVIFLSSGGTVYGNTTNRLINEESTTNPINNYGIMKLTIEKLMMMYNEIRYMENIVLRVSNPYGRGQKPEKKIGAISVFLDKIQHSEPITIFGNGDIVRDYIEIEDVCEAIYLSILYNVKKEVSPVFNIGTGEGNSLINIIKEIEIVTGKKALTSFESERSIDTKINVLDIEKSKFELGFQPKINLKAGIKKLVENNQIK